MKTRLNFAAKVLLVALFVVSAGLIQAEEVIRNFHSEILVKPDATLEVTETIAVSATGQEIKHGIYREFPTVYNDLYGNRVKISFELLGVKKDGQSEPYHTEQTATGIKIYAGDKDILIPPGEYTYEFHYRVNRELGFFPDHDELYWNVTGNGWIFPIEKASARVMLPVPISELAKVTQKSYIGPKGSTEISDYSLTHSDTAIFTEFSSHRPLEQYEGLTFVLSWPKGYVTEPTFREKAAYLWQDNAGILVAIVGTLCALWYFIRRWWQYGRDPKRRSIVPQYEVPADLPAGALAYISHPIVTVPSIAADVLDLAVRGYLKIEKKLKYYSLTRLQKADAHLPEEYKYVLEALFPGEDETLDLRPNTKEVQHAEDDLKDHISTEYGSKYFVRNYRYLAAGAVIMIGSLIASLIMMQGAEAAVSIFLVVWLTLWTMGVGPLAGAMVLLWIKVATERYGRLKTLATALVISLFAIPFLAAEIFVLVVLYLQTPTIVFALAVIDAFALAIFMYLLPRYTPLGRKLKDEIEGFKLFLSVTEKDRLNFHNPPEKTPELFEKFLPYALALGVSHQWAEQFADVLAKLDQNQFSNWNHGHLTAAAVGDFSGSFSQTMTSAGTAPGSRSGGSGGSSGGGGGGGGGGGW